MRPIAAALGGCIALCAAGAAHAQFAAQDFAATQCGAIESLFRSGLEPGEAAGGHASGGSGGPAPYAVNLPVPVPDTGRTHTVFAYLPGNYDGSSALPLLIALHGSAGSAAAAPDAAFELRDAWQPVAEREGAALLVPIASGAQGGWVPALDTPALACAIDYLERRYNLDRDRRYLWGFSAGAHYAHALALGNPRRFAAYAINAGALYALACAPPGNPSDCTSTLPGVARRIPVSLRVGNQDPLAPYVSGDLGRLQAAGWGVGTLAYDVFAGGHQVDADEIEAAWAWLEAHSLPP
jgi:poly(3-hydroxybutyrate) depolymerase